MLLSYSTDEPRNGETFINTVMSIQKVKNAVTSESIMNIDEYKDYTKIEIQELLSFCTTKIQDDNLSKEENEILFWNIEFLFDLSNNN